MLSFDKIAAQKATVSEKQVSLVTYPFSDPDPIPNPGKFYPYSRFEGYSDKGTEKNWKMVEPENALDLIKSKKYNKALESITRAKQWLPNLGVGKPYDVDERMEDFIALSCYQKLKDEIRSDECREKISGEKAVQNLLSDANDFLTA